MDDYTSWCIIWLSDRDGVELYVLYALLLACISAASVFTVVIMKNKPLIRNTLVFAAMALPIIYFYYKIGYHVPVYFSENRAPFFSSPSFGVVLFFLGISAALMLAARYSPITGAAVFLILLIPACFIPVVIFSPYEYNFIFMPALKLLQGYRLNEIFFQYDLLLSAVAALWLKLGLQFTHMYIFAEACLYITLSGLLLFSLKFFMNKTLPFLMLVATVLMSIYIIRADPTYGPQNSALRMQLWFPLMAIAYFLGPYSPAVGILTGFFVVVSNTFGVIYTAAYMEFIALLFIFDLLAGAGAANAVKNRLKPALMNAAIIAVSWLVYPALFGAGGNPAASAITSLSITFMKISRVSFFWHFFPVFAGAAAVLLIKRNAIGEKYFCSGFYLLTLAAGNSLYFFGRSHENNILVISASLMFVLFMLLDLISFGPPAEKSSVRSRLSNAAAVYLIPVLLIVSLALSNPNEINDKLQVQLSRLRSGQYKKVSAPKNIPAMVETIKQITSNSPRVYIASLTNEFLLYYLGGYRAVSYYTPSSAWYDKAGYVNFLKGLFDSGYYLVTDSPIYGTDILLGIKGLKAAKTDGLYFYHK